MVGEVISQKVEALDPVVTQKRVWHLGRLLVAFILGIVAIGIDVGVIIYWDLDFTSSVAASAIVVAVYSIILFFLLEPHIVKQIDQRIVLTRIVQGPGQIRTIEKPVVKYIEKPTIKEVVRTVERPVVRTIEKPVVRTVEKPVYVRSKRVMPSAKHYKYVGSTTTKTYHSTRSRLARLIKKKNRVYANTAEELEKKGFHPARHVIKKMKKGPKKKKALKKYKSRKKKAKKKS